MNTTEARKVKALKERREMWRYAGETLKGTAHLSVPSRARILAEYVEDLLIERRGMAETIRDQRIMLGNVEAILIAANRGYEAVKDDLHKAVIGEDDG